MSTSAAAIARTKVGRNDACPCGSGRKFKHCCGAIEAGAGFAAGTPWGPEPPVAVRQRLERLFLEAKGHFDARRWDEAIARFREIVRLDPNNPQAHHDLGMMALFSGRPAEAVASLRRALELKPGFDSALGYLATALLQLGREHEALLAYRELGRSAGDPAARRFHLALALKMEGHPEEAEKELRGLIALAPQMARARALLGELLSDRGIFEEAAEHLAKATEDFPPAFQQLTQVKRITEADRPLMDRMRGLADGPRLDVFPRINVHFALGKAYDDLGDYPEAMRHYEEANRLKAMSVRLDRAALIAKYDGLIAGSTAEALASARQALAKPASPGDDLPVFIVGMPRSGTTLVEQILSSHPAVAAGGELNFWGDQLDGWDRIGAAEAGMLIKAAEDYRALLRQIGPQALRVTDKRPGNFELLWLIRLALPDARVIHCRRDPVDTCLSIFFANFSTRLDYACDRGDLVFFYRQYERLMDHWRRVLPPDRFTEVEYETLIADREAETRRLVAFCGLEWNDACLTPERNGRAVKTASLWQARQPVYETSIGRWRRYEPWLGELRELLPAAGSRDVMSERMQALSLAAAQHWGGGRWAEAISLFEEIVRLDPNSPQARHDLGVACLSVGRLAEAVARLERAVELKPGFDSALSQLAFALLRQGREPEALLVYRRLSQTADDPLARLHFSALALEMEGKQEEGENELRRLIALAPELAKPRALLGELLSKRGQFEEAERHLTQAAEDFPPAFEHLTAVKRMTEADRPLIDRMRLLAERPHLDMMLKIRLQFGLGKAFDDLGDYAEAMRHYEAANGLKAMSARLDRPALAAKYNNIISGFTADALQRARQALAGPAGSGDDVPVFIVGMPRSGSTLIEQILSSHPAVAAGGELSFWVDRLRGWSASGVFSLDAATLFKAAEDYRAELSRIGPKALRVTDKRLWNFELLWLIRLALPDARIIHCRRHPVDTCLSIFFANFSAREDYAWDRGDLAFFYRQYERLMDHWRSALPPGRFTEVQYEALIADREAETRRLIAFCGLDWNDACLTPERNGRVVKTASLWQARQPVYTTSVARWRRYAPWLGELKELLPAAEAEG